MEETKRVDLERLSGRLAEDFLKHIGSNSKIIGLHGADEQTLMNLKQHLQEYFNKKKEQVLIILRNDAYSINVGYFLNTPPQPTP